MSLYRAAGVLALSIGLMSAPALAGSGSTRAQSFVSPSGSLTIQRQCTADGSACRYAYRGTGMKKAAPIIADMPETDPSWHGEIAALHFSCGSPCSAVFYVDAQRGVDTFQDPIAVDVRTQCYVHVANGNIQFNRLFSKTAPTRVIRAQDPAYRFMPAASLLHVVEGEFTAQGDFRLSYLNDAEQEKTALIRNPCAIR